MRCSRGSSRQKPVDELLGARSGSRWDALVDSDINDFCRKMPSQSECSIFVPELLDDNEDEPSQPSRPQSDFALEYQHLVHNSPARKKTVGGLETGIPSGQETVDCRTSSAEALPSENSPAAPSAQPAAAVIQSLQLHDGVQTAPHAACVNTQQFQSTSSGSTRQVSQRLRTQASSRSFRAAAMAAEAAFRGEQAIQEGVRITRACVSSV